MLLGNTLSQVAGSLLGEPVSLQGLEPRLRGAAGLPDLL